MALSSVNVVDVELLAGTPEGERQYLVTYQALTTTASDGPLTITTDPLFPSFQDSLSILNDFDDGAYPINYQCRRPNRLQLLNWEVKITYSTRGTKRHQQYENDPTLQEPIISTYPRRFSRATMHDKDGNIITNSAGDIIAGVEMDDFAWGLRIQKNFSTVASTTYRDYTNSVNSAVFFGLAARSWKMSGPRVEVKYRGNTTPYYQVTFEFETSSEADGTWDKLLVDRGIFQVVNGVRKKCEDDEGRPFSTPQNLDGGGEQLGPNIPPVNIVPSFELYESKDFADLNIPTDWPT